MSLIFRSFACKQSRRVPSRARFFRLCDDVPISVPVSFEAGKFSKKPLWTRSLWPAPSGPDIGLLEGYS